VKRVAAALSVGGLIAALALASCAGGGASKVPASQHPSATAPSAASSPSSPTGLRWGECEGTYQCAGLRVPRDYTDPTGAQLTLALIRRPANDPARRIGSIVINPGGPGGSGVDEVRYGGDQLFGPAVLDRFDIVGFDPRGVGSRGTSVSCLVGPPSVPAQAYPADAAELATWVSAIQALDTACQERSGELLPYVGTDNVARDLDRIRAALGEDKLTYVGWSYGTLIGALYAEMFPTRVRAMVLDGPVDPSLDLQGLNSGQAVGYQRQFDAFLADCARDAACAFHSGGSPRAAFDALEARFARGPIGGVSGWIAFSAIEAELVANDWNDLAEALAAADKGDASLLDGIVRPSIDVASAGQTGAVLCVDFPGPQSADGYVALAERLRGVAPDFGPFVAYQSLSCAFWPVPTQRVPRPVHPQGVPPILIIAATGDPATPLDWGQALSGQIPGSVLLIRQGAGHTSLSLILRSRSECVTQHFERYVLDLQLPQAGTMCS
jgi:pimeloyl-ACP methyl ester carboxylesterase